MPEATNIVQDSSLETHYPLYRALEHGIPLERLLLEGRWLHSSTHDYEAHKAGEHMHFYRRVLKTFDPETQTVLLSKKGSRRLVRELETPDREYTLDELEENNAINGCNVRASNHELF